MRPPMPLFHVSALPAPRVKGLFGLGGVAKKLARKSLQDSFKEMPALMEK